MYPIETRSRPLKIRRFGPIDIVIVLILAAAAVAFIPAMQAAAPSMVIVRKDDNVLARYPLTQNITFTIEGREGPLSINIAQQGVEVDHAACKNQVCVRTGRIKRSFQQIICAPNHVIVEITSSHPSDTIDAIVQ